LFWSTGGLAAKWLFSPIDVTTSAWPFPPPGLEVDPVVLAGARAFTAALILLVYVALRKPQALRVNLRDVVFLATFGTVALAGVHVAYYLAISHTNVATAILLEYLAPVIVLGFSVAFLGERMSWTLPVGVMLSVSGCALVVGMASGGGLSVSPAGLAWGLTAAGFFALYQLMGKWAAPRYSPWTLLTYGLVAAAVFWVVFLGGFTEMYELMATPPGGLAVVYMAVASTIIPFGASLKALHYIDATKAVVTSTLEPVIAGAAGWIVLSETFDGWQLLGGLLVLTAIVVVQRHEREQSPIPPVV
jgi:drug/metabolite transporter (DMT)-like permease